MLTIHYKNNYKYLNVIKINLVFYKSKIIIMMIRNRFRTLHSHSDSHSDEKRCSNCSDTDIVQGRFLGGNVPYLPL